MAQRKYFRHSSSFLVELDTVTLIGIEGTVILILMGALPAPSPVYCVGRDLGKYT